ncbi:MAG: hypothetical protein NVV74_15825 [Magnetospirillum sp.]|nr:hypothetical protein [Magnetospirillum sp.]
MNGARNGPISVYIDNNVWDFLFDRNIDLSVELPREEFCICLTREAEFEIPPMPADKRAFVEEMVRACGVRTDAYFGFFDETLPSHEQRVAGFDQGRFATPEEVAFLAQQRTPIGGKKRPSGLYKNEADASIAARAMARRFASIVLSLDKDRGPINRAYQQGAGSSFSTNLMPLVCRSAIISDSLFSVMSGSVVNCIGGGNVFRRG